MNLKYSRSAKGDLQQVRDYIVAEWGNPQTADKVIGRVIKSCTVLKKYPMLGFALKDKFDLDTDYRCLIIGEYVVFYNTVDETIWVRRIFSAKRDYIKDLFLG